MQAAMQSVHAFVCICDFVSVHLHGGSLACACVQLSSHGLLVQPATNHNLRSRNERQQKPKGETRDEER